MGTSYVPVKWCTADSFLGSNILRFLRSDTAMRRIFRPMMQRIVL